MVTKRGSPKCWLSLSLSLSHSHTHTQWSHTADTLVAQQSPWWSDASAQTKRGEAGGIRSASDPSGKRRKTKPEQHEEGLSNHRRGNETPAATTTKNTSSSNRTTRSGSAVQSRAFSALAWLSWAGHVTNVHNKNSSKHVWVNAQINNTGCNNHWMNSFSEFCFFHVFGCGFEYQWFSFNPNARFFKPNQQVPSI